MKLISDILIYLVEVFGTLALTLVLLRFFFQLVRADFYNPISQGIAKITNPVLIPLRRVIPGVFGIDIASIILALTIQMLVGELTAFFGYGALINPLTMLAAAIVGTLNVCTYIGLGSILILVVSSFIAPQSTHPIILLAQQLLAPLMTPIQKAIPPMGGLDFSVMIIGIGIVVIQKVLLAAATSIGNLVTLVIGF